MSTVAAFASSCNVPIVPCAGISLDVDDDDRPSPRPSARPRGQALRHRAGRSAVAVRQPHRQGRARASPSQPLSHADGRGDLRPSRRRPPRRHRALLPLGSERAPARGPRRARRLGVLLQVQRHLAQGAQGRRFRRARRRVLLPQRHRDRALRHPRPQRAHPAAGSPAGEPHRHPQARALAQARRAVRPHRIRSPGAYLELFGRGVRKGWTVWGNQASEDYRPDWDTYAYTSKSLAAE